jgi:histidine ammonia-lyase
MLAYGIHIQMWGEHLSRNADKIAALSLDAFDCRLEPFHPAIHAIRPHPGQVETAAVIRELLADSEIANQIKLRFRTPILFAAYRKYTGRPKMYWLTLAKCLKPK